MDNRALRPLQLGGGQVTTDEVGRTRLSIPPTKGVYADAQLDDYRALQRAEFSWSPPATLRLRARASHATPPGTLGFGFWNDPFGISLVGAGGARRFPAPPQAVWFFYGSSENDFTFAKNGPGSGWNAAVLRSVRYPALVLLPGAAAAFGLARLPLIRRWIVPLVRRQASAAEFELSAHLDEWHEYALKWRAEGVTFEVDGAVVAKTELVPHEPLGFITWIDNQYAVLSEAAGIRFGLLPTNEEYWLEIENLQIESR